MIGGVRGYKICFVADRTSMFPVSQAMTARRNVQLTSPVGVYREEWAAIQARVSCVTTSDRPC